MSDPRYLPQSRRQRYPLYRLAHVTGADVGPLATPEGANVFLTEREAERRAVALGLHPFAVWPEMVDHVVEDCTKTCAYERCDAEFIPDLRRQDYCTTTCRQRQGALLQYRRHGEQIRQAERERKARAMADPERAAEIRRQNRTAQRAAKQKKQRMETQQ